jgi:PIN domain nuclease of toxin-antitoxin system
LKYLIDTNILIWFIEENSKLPSSISEIINDDNSEIYISIVSLWEISIKLSIGKLELPKSLNEIFAEVFADDCFLILPLKQSHILENLQLPFYHRDPFDRIIYAQSIKEKLTLLYTDEIFDKYKNGS